MMPSEHAAPPGSVSMVAIGQYTQGFPPPDILPLPSRANEVLAPCVCPWLSKVAAVINVTSTPNNPNVY